MADSQKGVDLAVSILLVIIVAATILPSAFNDWFDANTSSWPAMMDSIWSLVPLFAILALALYFYNAAETG